MLTSVDSYTLTLYEQLYTFEVTSSTVFVRNNTSLSWKGLCDIRSINAVYNSSSLIHVKLTNDTSYVLYLEKAQLKELQKLSTCPVAVYSSPDFLIHNDTKSCYLYHLKSGKLSVKLNHQLIGYDFRTKSYIFKTADGAHAYLKDSPILKPYNNPCLNSVTSLPISWVTVISAHSLILGTSLSRVMYVYDGIIKSHFRLPHSIDHISPTSDIQIRVSGSCVSTDLTLPVLGLVRTPEQGDSGEVSGAMQQLVVSCDNHIRKQLVDLNRLHCRHEKKVDFLAEIWNKLFELNNVDGGVQDFSANRVTKKRKIENVISSSLDLNVTQLPFQLPISPNTSTEISIFLESDRTISAYCTDVFKPLLSTCNGLPCDYSEFVTLPRSLRFGETKYDVKLTTEFRENLRKMFAEALVSGQDDLMVDTLAHLTKIVLAIDNR